MMKGGKNKKHFSWGRFFKKLFFGLLFIAFVGVCGWSLLFSDYTKIHEIEIATEKIDETDLQNILNNLMAGFWLKYLPRDNFFLFPRKEFENQVREEYKLIREINFENEFPHKIKIEIEERETMAIWCSRDKCFLIDETGLVFYELQSSEKDERFKELQIIIDNSHSELQVGENIKDNKMASFVVGLRNGLKEKLDLEIKRQVEIPSAISGELRVTTEEGWQIYFDLRRDYVEQIELLDEILESSILKEERRKLNYIDLRIEGRAIYNSSYKAEESSEKE